MNLYAYVQNNPLTHIDPSGHVREGANVRINLENARRYGAGSDVYWQVRSQLGSEAKEIIPGATEDDNNLFKYWFGVATMTSDYSELNTPENAEWATTLLSEVFQEDYEYQMAATNDMMNFVLASIDLAWIPRAKVVKSVSHFERGRQFEGDVLSELGFLANTKKIRNSIPDSITNGRIIEVKDQIYISKSGQFRDYLDSGMPIDLIVSPRATVSGPLKDAILNGGGTIRVRHSNGTYTSY